MLRKLVGLREVPLRALRLVVAPSAQNTSPCVVIRVFIRPLPYISNQIHYAKRTGAFGMSGYVAGGHHVAPFVGGGYGIGRPLISPRISPSIQSLCRILPLPLMRQSLAGPLGISTRV